MKIINSLLSLLFVIGAVSFASATLDNGGTSLADPYVSDYVVAQDTVPLNERFGDYLNNPSNNPFDLNDPSIIEKEIEYDPVTGNYIIKEKIGEDYYRMPTYMTFEEYLDYRAKEQEQQYFDKLSGVSTANKGSASGEEDPIAKFEDDIKNTLIDRLFGGSDVEIRPQGNIELTFGADFQRIQNPVLTIRQQRQGGFDFDMNIQMNVTGKIGEKLNLSTNYNTQATFDFENRMKLQYDSDAFSEDEIIKNIDVGNISFPLKNSLIEGSSNLFGVRIDSKWGRLSLSTVASQQKSRRERLELQGGSQLQEFEVRADQYDENRHFFLSHFNRDNFKEGLSNLPQINSLFKINPQEIQVWITNDRNATEGVREIVAIADLGEPNAEKMTSTNPDLQPPMVPRFRDIRGQQGLPDNRANPIFENLIANENSRGIESAVATLIGPSFSLEQAKDFEKVTARLLSPSEYTYHPELGFISMNTPVQPDQVLAVSYQYDYNGQVFKVGEFGNDNYDSTGVLFVKMLKSTIQRIDLPTWDLMMKNVYSIGAYQVDQNDFRLDIYYEDPREGEIRFLPESSLEGDPLLQVFNLDRLNVQGDPCPDGIFDFVPGVTIQPRNGRIMFPVLEPFGDDLREAFSEPGDSIFIPKYEYFHLYDSTVTRAREHQNLNRFIIKGTYKSSGGGGGGNEISLGAFNLPRGSVRVTAGGQTLQEGADYEVDYSTGRVTIFNEAYINSDIPVNVSFEDNTLFGFQTRTLLGTRADYEVSKNFNIGATWMHLFERPFTQKVNIGDDPINNSVYGLDVNFSKDAPWLTKAVDRIPFIDTKEPSTISFQAEAAMLRPGHARAINQDLDEDGNDERGGVVYIDDFEGATSSIDLRTPTNRWVMASVPQDTSLFPESRFIDTTLSGVNRAKLNWYRIDLSVANNQSDPYQAAIRQTEVFPNTSIQPGQNNTIQTLDLTYYPDERGPYNFDLPSALGGTDFSDGIDAGGRLVNPQSRWGGIMRALNTNDFQAANIEYVEFWLLDPFINGRNDGDLYINLGNISEDILRDSRKFYENGLPTSTRDAQTDVTRWGRIPIAQAIVNAFDNSGDADRMMQDVGLDGFDNDGERVQFGDILQLYQANMNTNAFNDINADPSSDDFVFFRDPSLENEDVFGKYRKFNNPEGNSQTPGATGQLQSGTNIPDTEDINRDNTLNETEAYFQYHIPLRGNATGGFLDFRNTPFVTDSIRGPDERIWYRFQVPVAQFTDQIGGIQDFRSIRFMRMFVRGFQQRTTLRFARLELARNQWRRYQLQLDSANCVDVAPGQPTNTLFDVDAVNVEENSNRTPFNYVLPPGIRREQANNTAFPDLLQNEQSLAIEVCNLCEQFGNRRGGTRGVYKTVNMDMRLYKRLQMFVHGEPLRGTNNVSDLQSGDLGVFVRLGSDFQTNYYEYEIPLVLSDSSVSPLDPEYVRTVWPIANDFDIVLDDLKEIKLQRNDSGTPFDEVYEADDPNDPTGQRKIRIRGNPHLGPLKSIMIGVVNRDDEPHCAEIWVNEMRLTGLDERGGIAATGRLDLKLADFGTFTTAVEYRGIGYGGIEERLVQRSREETIQLDASSSLELGKFLPENSGVKIPMYLQYSKTIRNPEFDPYDKDITLQRKIDRADNAADKDSIKQQAQHVTELKSVNFTNVRKERTNTDKKPMPWNIENFSASYSFTETDRRDPFISSDNIKVHNGSLDYSYNRGGSFITPFKKLIKKDKYFKLITDFGFNPLPNSFAFSTSMNREYQVTKYRFTDLAPQFSTFYNKQFTWDRTYDLKWDLTKNLKMNFSAFNTAVIDELKELDENGDPRSQAELREFIWEGIRDFGRTKLYRHNVNVSYNVPFKNIPFMDWIQVRAQYGGDYSWTAAALNVDSLGNVIQNSQTRQINGDLNFENLYRKSKYLDKISRGKKKKGRGNNRGNRNRGRNAKGSSDSSKTGGGDGGGGKGGSSDDGKTPSRPMLDKGKSNVEGGSSDGKSSIASADGAGGKKKGKGRRGGSKKDKKKKKDREPSVAERILIRPLLLLRKARLTYSENYATVVPGYMPQTSYFGSTDKFTAPGLDFVAGLQPNIQGRDGQNDWLDAAEQKGWISTSVFLNQQVLQDFSQDVSARVTLEPFKDFRIELSADRRKSENTSVYFRDTVLDATTDLVHSIPREVGSYSISYFAMRTLFNDDIVGLFNEFEDNRNIISNRLGAAGSSHDKDDGFAEGYGRVQQDVLLPAFIAAYSGQDAATMELDNNNNYLNVLLRTLPKVNWQLTYDGLAKLPWFKEYFQSFSLSHGYRSNLTINSFNTEQFFDESNPTLVDNNQNFYSRFEIPNVVINEQFAPLLGVDMKLKNELSLRADFSRSRNLSMSFMDYRLAESKSTEYLVSIGYTMKNVVFGFLNKGAKKSPRSSKSKKNDPKSGSSRKKKDEGGDLTFDFEFSFNDNVTINHTLDEAGSGQATRGSRDITISPSVDYDVNKRLNIRLFFDRRQTNPKNSQSFPITNTQGGVTVTFSLN
ncbi:MAG: cell surface protein SprA [Bacteroidota bacterium]